MNLLNLLIRKYSKLPGLLINKVYWQLLLKKDSGHQLEGGEYIIDKQIKKAYDKHRYFGSQPLLCSFKKFIFWNIELVRKWEREALKKRALTTDNLLSVEQARRQLSERIQKYFEENKEVQITISESKILKGQKLQKAWMIRR